jgi:hypothetical protein
MGKRRKSKDEIINGLLETKFADDDPKYIDSNAAWLESLTVEELIYMQEEWDVLGDN